MVAVAPRWKSQNAGIVALSLVGVVFVGAAFDKALDIDGFSYIIQYHINSRSPLVVSGLTVMVLIWEAVLGVSLLTDVGATFGIRAAVGTLIVFSLALTRMILDPASPESCGCGRVLSLLQDAEAASVVGLLRNGLLIACLLFGARASYVPTRFQQ